MASPGTRCTACNHKRVVEINRLRAEGWSLRRLGKAFELSHNVMARHFGERHVGTPDLEVQPGKAPTPAPEAMRRVEGAPQQPAGADYEPPRTEVERLERIRDELQRRVDTGKARTDEIRELRMTLQTLAEIRGENVPRVATINDVQGLPELIAAWFEVLERFPEARAAMAEATKRLAPQLLGRPDAS